MCVELGAPPIEPLAAGVLRNLVARVLKESGFVAHCRCGAARFCPLTPAGNDGYEQFHQLHAGCFRAPA
jgi:hypothetical protein